jgi:hypothetical protein
MHLRKLTTPLAILAATLGVSAFATSAQAAVVDNDATSLLTDPEVTLTDGNVAFDWTQGKVTPRLTGNLNVVNGDDACFRVRIDSYDINNTLLHSNHGAKACPNNDNQHSYPVDLSAPSDALTHRVTVAVEKETLKDGWQTKDQDTNLYVTPHRDAVTISGSGINADGNVGWHIDNTGKSIGEYDGTLTFDGFSNCGRISLRYFDDVGKKVDEVDGSKHCPPDLGHYTFFDTLVPTPSSSAIKVKVVMQSKVGGSWVDVSSKTVSIAE